MIRMILKESADGVVGDYIFDDTILSIDTVGKMASHALKTRPDDCNKLLKECGVTLYNNEDVKRTFTVMIWNC